MKHTTPLLAMAALALAGCATDTAAPRPEVALPAQYASVPASASASAPANASAATSANAPTSTSAAAPAPISPNWWTLYADPTLDALVAAALQGNADLRLAMARVDETAAVVGQARAAQWPGVDLGASATRSRSSTLSGQPANPNGPESTSHRLALSTSFEIDLWGRLRNASAAAQAQLLAAQYARDAVQLALAGSTAQVYFSLRALDAQLAVNEAALRTYREALQLVERRAAGGVASPLEVAQARTALAANSAQRPELQRQRALLENQLGVLTGQPGRSVAASSALAAMPLPATPPAGLPSDLLERRPDVQQALSQLRAAQAQVAVARAAMWPTLALTGSFGGQSADLADLLKSGARVWSIGPSLLLPLFDGGRNAARTDQARAQAEQAAIGYQKAVQTAFRETADALVGTEQGARQELEVQAQRGAAAETLRIATRRYEAGYAGYLEVLDAQRAALDAELAFVRVRQLRLDSSVAVLKALGGGWAVPNGKPAQP